jgi:hypothetical protein
MATMTRGTLPHARRLAVVHLSAATLALACKSATESPTKPPDIMAIGSGNAQSALINRRSRSR